ncbi:hypothetical protein PTKIN_Ptkin03bG0249000 [Pterospermum kingtungense]
MKKLHKPIHHHHHQTDRLPIMLLRNSISNTKNFFRKTLQSLKSFFSGCEPYHKLPKTSSYNPYPFTAPGVDMNPQTSTTNCQDLDTFYTGFTDRWDSDNGKTKKRNKTKVTSTSTGEQKEGNEEIDESRTRNISATVVKREEHFLYSKSKREARSLSVAQKLKELEMMDLSNVDHVLDIEEVLHYYSRLTCPAYVDIVDKFFTDMYTEFLGPPGSPRSVNSRPKFRSVRA